MENVNNIESKNNILNSSELGALRSIKSKKDVRVKLAQSSDIKHGEENIKTFKTLSTQETNIQQENTKYQIEDFEMLSPVIKNVIISLIKSVNQETNTEEKGKKILQLGMICIKDIIKNTITGESIVNGTSQIPNKEVIQSLQSLSKIITDAVKINPKLKNEAIESISKQSKLYEKSAPYVSNELGKIISKI